MEAKWKTACARSKIYPINRMKQLNAKTKRLLLLRAIPARLVAQPFLLLTRLLLSGLACYLSGCSPQERNASQVGQPVKIILDTDIAPDVDDAGAIAVLHALADRGEAEVLGVLCNTTTEWGAPCIDAFNTYYGRPDVPIGTLKGAGNSGDDPGWSGLTYNRYIAQHFRNDIGNGKNAPDAVAVYRQVLAAQPDTSVVIVSVGALTNLRNLIRSPADSVSPLPGLELVRKKVKLLSLMAGNYPRGIRKDPNFSMDIGASVEVMATWPTHIVLSGEEIGKEIKTGAGLFRTKVQNPVREAYLQWDRHFWTKWDSTFRPEVTVHPHDSYDQTSVLYAVRGAGQYWTLSPSGRVNVNQEAYNEWQATPDGKHRYLIARMPPAQLAGILEELMSATPKKYPVTNPQH
jgi:hypothetical protein